MSGTPAPSTTATHVVVFRLDGQRFALPLASVERVLRAVEITPLPNAPAIVLGAIDMHGRVLPVLNIRRRFGLPDRELRPEDALLVAHTGQRAVVLTIDEADGVVEASPEAIVGATQIVPGLEHFSGVLKMTDGLTLIHDLETFLSFDETRALDVALKAATRRVSTATRSIERAPGE